MLSKIALVMKSLLQLESPYNASTIGKNRLKKTSRKFVLSVQQCLAGNIYKNRTKTNTLFYL